MVERTSFPNPNNLRATAILDIEHEAIQKLAKLLLGNAGADVQVLRESSSSLSGYCSADLQRERMAANVCDTPERCEVHAANGQRCWKQSRERREFPLGYMALRLRKLLVSAFPVDSILYSQDGYLGVAAILCRRQ